MGDVNVVSTTQKIVVDPATSSVAIINSGPVGPAGPMGEVSTTQLNTAITNHANATDSHGDRAFAIGLVNTEAASRTSADTALGNLIDDEVTRATAAESALDARVDPLEAYGYPDKLSATAPADASSWLRQADGRRLIKVGTTWVEPTRGMLVQNVERQLVTFTAATPPHISGNLLTHDQQRGIGLSPNTSFLTITNNANGGADGGGASRWAVGALTSYVYNQRLSVVTAPGEARTITFRMERIAGTGSRTIGIEAYYFNSSNVVIGSAVTATVAVSFPVGSALTFTHNVPAAPAGTEKIEFMIYGHPTLGWLNGDVYDISVLCVRASPTIPGSSGVAASGLVIAPGPGACVRLGSRGIIATTAAQYSYVDIKFATAKTSGRHAMGLVGTQRSGTINSDGLLVDTACYPAGWFAISRTKEPFLSAGHGAAIVSPHIEATLAAAHTGWTISGTSVTNGAELVISDVTIESIT